MRPTTALALAVMTMKFFIISLLLQLILNDHQQTGHINLLVQAQQINNIQIASATTTTTTTTPLTSSSSITPTIRNNNGLLRPPPPRVYLNKCCHFDEYLNGTECLTGGSDKWKPLIYNIYQKTYFKPQGQSPRYMIFDENIKPTIKSNKTYTNYQNKTSVTDCIDENELEFFNKIVLFTNGSLFLSEHSMLIEPHRFCVDQDAALVCFPNEKRKSIATGPILKLKKCCSKFQRYNIKTNTCINAIDGEEKLKLIDFDEKFYQTIYGFPDCIEYSTTYTMIGNWKDAKLHHETGYLQIYNKNLSTWDYCLENVYNNDSTSMSTTKIFACLHHFGTIDAPANLTTSHTQVAVLNIGIIISVTFLLATLIAGYMMPSVHHVLHWRCQIYYVFCLFIGELILAYTQLSKTLELGSATCLSLASIMHFFFLSAFFWLNTMCFNIWWTFRDFRPSSLERNQELLRLRLYSAYAWGIPLLICITAFCIDHVPDTQLLRPDFGVRSCWFSGEKLSIFAYFYGPVGILIFVNIILFLSTTHQLTCGLWKRDNVKTTSEKTALGRVCIKLVVVMGITWMADIISWLVGAQHSTLWFFADLVNALQGVFIFIVVGCQPQVWSACKRLCCPRARQEITNTTNGVQHSVSSHGLPSMGGCGSDTTQNTSINTTIGGNGGGCAGHQTPTKIPMETVC